jgi:LuxR family maltose regulon positive regulatory protein
MPPEAAYTLRTVHGAALADQGDRTTGLAEMGAARAEFGDRPAPAGMVASLVVLEHQVALLSGNLGATAEAGRWLATAVGASSETLLLKARTEAARGRHEAARLTLAPVHTSDRSLLLGHTRVEAHLIEAEDTGSVRPLALAGPLTQELLDAWLARHQGAFAASVAAARAAVVSDPAVLLSERELAVLALLPSLLSAGEIAAEFTVSVNTVKSHIRSIYAKLGVSSRRTAVAAARGRGLLR